MLAAMHRPLLLSSALALLALCGCDSEGVNADFTGISLYMSFPADWGVSELHTTGTLDDGQPAFQMGITPVSDDPAVDGVKTELLAIILEANKAGERVRIHVDGRDTTGAVVGAGDDVLRLNLGFFVTSTVTLTADVLCGNGVLDDGEGCDDGDRLEANGCSPTCEIEPDWICVNEPSRCSPASATALVDAQTNDCPGNGTLETPFCSIARALDAPWASTIALLPGRYDEDLSITRAVQINADLGAELETTTSPALSVLSDGVGIHGLTVRGVSRLGGGIVVGGTGDVTLQAMQVGPSSTVGISVQDSALLRLHNSRVLNNSGGGLRLASDRGYIVRNIFFTGNGDSQAEFGGVNFVKAPRNSIFANNTVADNEAARPGTGGLVCDEPTPVVNTIVWNSGTITASVADTCDFAFSDVGPLETGLVLPSGNFSEDPLFSAGYRLGPNSPCLDRGDPQSIADEVAPAFDFEDQPRPQGPNIDVGADEAG